MALRGHSLDRTSQWSLACPLWVGGTGIVRTRGTPTFFLALDGTHVVSSLAGGASSCSIVAAGYRMDDGSNDGVFVLLSLHTDGCRSRWSIFLALLEVMT